jgi:hypothetical protein
MVENANVTRLIYLGKKLFYLILLVILSSIILLFIYIPLFVYLSDYYEYYSYYTYNNVTITKVVKLNEVKIYYGRFEKKDKKPRSYFYSNNIEIHNLPILFDASGKVFVTDKPHFYKIIENNSNIILLDEYDFLKYKLLNQFDGKNPKILLVNSIPCFYNYHEERFNNGHFFLQDYDRKLNNYGEKYSTYDSSKVKREYELDKNNILDKIF